ncbi:regulator of G-protein signaling 12-like, partial [Protobothrops mucrosquamatus]|uniref:regulator of G-protein signaling 12-like n=1 Tax=Protobothrops mucrosquamatus TaxID=103944 RepID=UPI000775FE2F
LSFRAQEIFNRYLCSKATTPVNIDSQVQLADDVLTAPHPHMFKDQQLQIFNLMKFDSYARFLKSPFYQECVLAEVEGRPVPDPQCVTSSPTLKSSFGPDTFSVSTPRKPLVLHQDSSILDAQSLRLERRTLFRLDLVPINRSVGLKAKPTKPVTEVLRPVVAKYGLNLNNLVARLVSNSLNYNSFWVLGFFFSFIARRFLYDK